MQTRVDPSPPLFAETAAAVAAALGTESGRGLDAAEVARRRAHWGRIALPAPPPRRLLGILAAQFRSLVIWLLILAAAAAFAFGDMVEGAAIAVVVLLNSAIGFATELRATRSIEALRRIGRVMARVRRSGRAMLLPADEIVPGDVIELEAGDRVSADLRLIEAAAMQIDESTLTGESAPVDKAIAPLPADTPLADRRNIAFTGTVVTRGSGLGIAVATGARSELGRISALTAAAEPERSPLEKRLDRLSRQLVWVALGLALAVAVAGLIGGRDPLLMIEMGVALAVAAVPEGLPVVATIALARGMWRMAERNALIERLSAVETLGATTVIFTDKTGTLTENRMAVARLLLPAAGDMVEVSVDTQDLDQPFTVGDRPPGENETAALRAALDIGALCSNAWLSAPKDKQDTGPDDAVGDPLEVALLHAAHLAGSRRDALLDRWPERHEVPFDSATRMMATVHDADGGVLIAVKGAPEAVLAAATRLPDGRAVDDTLRRQWLEAAHSLALGGLRCLAVARRRGPARTADHPFRDLELLGIVGLLDPPRADVPEALAACRSAGIRVVMVTGDHAATALAIARAVGLADGLTDDGATVIEGRDLRPVAELDAATRERLLAARVFARVSPEQKLDLVTLYQEAGEVVAMTGDGVNDAPALSKADIGVAMGKRGTDVAREAAAMVLRDDSFPSIVAAVRQGRVILGNIRRFVLYLLSCNLSEVLVVSLAVIAGLPLPLLPLQILFLNLVTDVLPAFALGIGEGEADVMQRPPRPPGQPILGRRQWRAVALHGMSITAATLGALALAHVWLKLPEAEATTISFLTLAFAQLWHVFNMRGAGSGPWRNEITGNPYIWAALVACILLVLVVIYVPPLGAVLQLVPPQPEGWLLAVSASLLPLVLGQAAALTLPIRR
jgi:Ca2+-transporting ATPase